MCVALERTPERSIDNVLFKAEAQVNRDASGLAMVGVVTENERDRNQLILVCDSPSGERRSVVLRRSPLVLGRSRDCDVVLRDPGVSRRHVVIDRTVEGWEVRRCDGAATLYVNHCEVDRALLRVGDVVRVGLCCLVLVDSSDAETAQLAEGAPSRGSAAAAAAPEPSITPLWDAERIGDEVRRWLAGHAEVIDTDLIWRSGRAGKDAAKDPADSAADVGADVAACRVVQKLAANGTVLETLIPAGALAAIRVTLRQPPTETTSFVRSLFQAIASVCGVMAVQRTPLATGGDDATGQPLVGGAAYPRCIGKSAVAQRLRGLVSRIARSEATVLLTGESGTGKSMAARLLHDQSSRAGRPFLAVNCAAIPESLIESELFGHTRGAFTGAVDTRAGAFEVAGTGTIFLDEIAELPLPSQSKLLRVLEERCFQRIGSSRPQAMQARVIAATNGDLTRMVEEGRMRRDLYYRLSVVRLEIPPLRERVEDIMAIAEHLLPEIARRDGRTVVGFSPDAVKAICTYDWPGNVRELRNAVEYAVVLGQGSWIEAGDLPIPVPAGLLPVAEEDDGDHILLPMNLAQLELKAIKSALRATNGNRTRAASLLGINRVTLYKKLCQPAAARDVHDVAVDAVESEAVG
ncbi:MAG: sigma54 specific transcriptional regulator, Fis family [Myxococcales bacterium]|nr:sigma54 specific transcriptional regulator, Fis family [Myxococcales bacterium]